jgi:hypothetical protein
MLKIPETGLIMAAIELRIETDGANHVRAVLYCPASS